MDGRTFSQNPHKQGEGYHHHLFDSRIQVTPSSIPSMMYNAGVYIHGGTYGTNAPGYKKLRGYFLSSQLNESDIFHY